MWQRPGRVQRWANGVGWALIVAAVLIVIGVIVSPGGDDITLTAPTKAKTATTTGTSTATSGTATGETATLATAAASTTTSNHGDSTTTTTTLPLFSEPMSLSGSGNDVVDLVVPGDEPAIVRLQHSGSRGFVVVSYGGSGDRIDSLVNEIGRYSGTRPINLVSGREVALLEIHADGLWSIDVLPLAEARIVTEGSIAGSGDDVVVDPDPLRGAVRVDLTHSGDSNFAIWVYSETDRDLLVNEIGPFEGTVLGIDNMLIYDITADGDWSIDVS